MGVVKHRLFWPIAALLTLVVINTVARPQFIKVTVRDGQLYGALIDILRNSAPLMLVALGMTIVIATRGIDLSVGAVMAVSGAVALTIIHGLGEPRQRRHGGVRGRCRAPRGARARVMERHPHRGAGDPAHHRHARAHAGGPWCGPPDHRGLHHHRQQRALRVHRHRVPADPSVRVPHLLDGNPRDRRVRTQDGARHAHRGGGHQPGGEPPGRCPVARDHLQRVRRQRADGRHRGRHLQLEHQGRRRQRRRACSSSCTPSSLSCWAARHCRGASSASPAR